MAILTGIQTRSYMVGRIKAGDKDEEGRPHRLEGFRFTSPSPKVAGEIAEFYHGEEPRPWGRQWEVYTSLTEIAVALPPGNLVINQSMMRWSGGGPTMVCDGVTTTRPGRGPCQCPQPDDPDDPDSVWAAINERRRLAGQKNPAGCYPYTWINVSLPDIGGFGVWKLLSKSENAAAEIIAQAVLLERARAAGQFLPARLALEYRESRVDGLLRQYNVPALRINDSIRALAAKGGEFAGRPLAEQLPPAPGQARAITTGSSAPPPTATPSPGVPAPAVAGEVIDDGIADAEIVDEWLDAALRTAESLTTEEAGRRLFIATAARARAGDCEPADAGRVQATISARIADLRSDLAAELDPADPWAVKAADLAGEPDADAALAELGEAHAAGQVDQARAARVRAAILVRYPKATAA